MRSDAYDGGYMIKKSVKKYLIIPIMILLVSIVFTGCFGSGFGAPEQTPPPEKEYKSIEELSAAVASAKADASATDEVNLKSLASLYLLKNPPDGAAVSTIKISSQAIRVGYEFGTTVEDGFDNQIQIIWYRNANVASFISDAQKTMVEYDEIKSGNMQYLRIAPDVQLTVTAAPGSTAEAQPTPKTAKYCQFVYWVQDNGAFMAAVPLNFTDEDIGKYCVASLFEIK